MQVLIIGARGQLGTDLIKAFDDCQIIQYTSDDLDITDEASVQQQIAFSAPDLVINAAAFTRVDECEREHIRAFEVNALGPRNLALSCKKWDIPLVHVSTNYVFDGFKDSPYIEDDPASPLNAYGVSKLAGEHYLNSLWEKNYIVRVAGLFGLTPSRMKGTNFVEAMLRLGSKGNPLRIVSDESLSPTYTTDAADVIRRLVETNNFGAYHVTNSGGCTWMEFAQEIFDQSNMSVQLVPVTASDYGAPARRPVNSCLDNSKIIGLGLGPLRSWQDALRDYLQHRTS